MSFLSANIFQLLSLIIWCFLWTAGGFWIAKTAFNLRENELAIAGLGLGLVVENWLANLLSQFLPVPLSFWLSAVLVFVLGLIFVFTKGKPKLKELFQIPFYPLQWVLLAGLTLVFISIGRGQALFDDFQNLPITSLIATGDIPPYFALDPGINFGYHYFTMLFAGQLMRIADIFVWTALDIARGIGFALTVMYMAFFTQRATRSKLGGLLGGLMTMFAGGTRWLLLLFPPGVLSKISSHINMIGSGGSSGADLSQAVLNTWAASGFGPYQVPFAFANGFFTSGALGFHAGWGGLIGVLMGLLLLTHNHWRTWRAWVVSIILIASLGLSNEVNLAQICFGFVIVAGIYMLIKKTWRLPKSLSSWFVVLFAGGFIALLQGGVLTALVIGWAQKLLPGFEAGQAYHTFKFSLFFPPAILSTHLGNLQFNNPYHILVLLLEIGPILFLVPLTIIWTIKAFRHGRWFESAYSISSFAGLGLSVVELSGAAGSTALTRAQSLFIDVTRIFGTPALWNWARGRSDKTKTLVGAMLLVIMLGGVVLLGIQLISAPLPVYSDFINDLDAQMTDKYWDQLEPYALVFDPDPYRAPVVFGRSNLSSNDWFDRKPIWLELREYPDLYAMRKAGYDYMYLDAAYWDSLSPQTHELLEDSCVIKVEELTQAFPNDFRWLLDVRNCENDY